MRHYEWKRDEGQSNKKSKKRIHQPNFMPVEEQAYQNDRPERNLFQRLSSFKHREAVTKSPSLIRAPSA